ncbi:MAG: protein translocase subunit SecDF, partial [Bacteroidota bacterium]
IDFAQRQAYLDALWKEPAFRWLGIQYTYEQIKENALNLGLDLQGGMHVILEVSPGHLVRALAGNSKDPTFLAALAEAERNQQAHPAQPFTKLFHQAYQRLNPTSSLSEVFAVTARRGRTTRDTTDQAILKLLDAEINNAVDRSFDIIRSRIDQFGTSQPNIQRLQGGRIQVELPGATNPARVRKLLQGVARLQFWAVYEPKELASALQSIDTLLAQEEKAHTHDGAGATASRAQAVATQPDTTDGPIYPSPFLGKLQPGYGLAYAPADVPAIQQILARKDVKQLLPADLIWLWDVKPTPLTDGNDIVMLYPIRAQKDAQPLLSGTVITDARQSFDERGRPTVTMQMNSQGTRAWRKITADNIGQRIAIALDDRVYSAPVVHTEIPNGNSQITGSFTIEEAKDLANILKAGSLPAPVKIVEEAIIGPTLSQEAQTKGITSMLLGLGLVVLFMLGYYARGGAIANVALLFNILFLLGILAQLNATLTLTGIAGIVLTIGMSIDANVLIFERIREELRKGVPVQGAIQEGYQKAYSSIIDANVTTFLTGAILYFLGQGPIRGFATTLMIGILTSFFTSVFITRLIITWVVQRGYASRLSFGFSHTKDLLHGTNVPFIRQRRIFYAVSGLFIVVGLGLMIQQGGPTLGVDFTGGRSYVVSLSEAVEPTTLKTRLGDNLGDPGLEVKTYGADNVVKITTSYRIQEDSAEADEQIKNELSASIATCTGLRPTENMTEQSDKTFAIASAIKVGANIADDTQSAAKKSILLSLLMIFGYILVRFRQWQFGLAAVIALFHDTLAVLAAFAMAKAFGYVYEVDQIFIAAILTIIGYSINDTVVVFDRIRENRRSKAGRDFLRIANNAINETLTRTLITSLTTLMAVAVLFIWGGEVLRGFSFALLIGIVFGTYSSICIATPLVIDLGGKYHSKGQ